MTEGIVKPPFPRTKLHFPVWRKTGGVCFYCGQKVDCGGRGYVTEHIISGLDQFENLVPACSRCNNSKSNDPLAPFRRRLSLYLSSVPFFDEKQRAYLAAMRVYPPRVTGFRFWFEGAQGRERLRHTHTAAQLGRLYEIVALAEHQTAREILDPSGPGVRQRRQP